MTQLVDMLTPPSSYKCPHCGAMHVDARERPACLDVKNWPTGFAPLDAATQRIRDLEREVERLKPFEAKAERWFAEIEQRETDRADAERLRWLVERVATSPKSDAVTITAWDMWWDSSTVNIRALIDADRAKEGE